MYKKDKNRILSYKFSNYYYILVKTIILGYIKYTVKKNEIRK